MRLAGEALRQSDTLAVTHERGYPAARQDTAPLDPPARFRREDRRSRRFHAADRGLNHHRHRARQ